MSTPSQTNKILTKHFNKWVSSKNGILQSAKVDVRRRQKPQVVGFC
jgi:hypothetical protein